MSKIVKDTPIRKNNKTYGVGEEFPYSDKDKKLLWNLTEVKDLSANSSKAEEKKTSKDGPKENSEKSSETKKPTTKKKVVVKKEKQS